MPLRSPCCCNPVVALLLVLGVLVAVPVGSVRADELPSLPLPDCFANGLTPNASTDCEGTLHFGQGGGNETPPYPVQGEIALATSTRELDFRSDADRPEIAQLVTFTFTLPPEKQGPGPAGSTYRSVVVPNWQEWIHNFQNIYLHCRQTTDEFWQGGCDTAPMGMAANPEQVLLVRQGTCGPTDTSCTYRVTWGPYDKRVRTPMIFRVRFDWFVRYTRQLADGTYDGCGDVTANGCGNAPAGFSLTTFATTSPAPLQAIGTVRRLGAKAFEFDARESSPKADVRTYDWGVSFPDANAPMGFSSFLSTAPVFIFDFADYPGIPSGFLASGSAASLIVKDRWNRAAFSSAPYTFLEPVGTEGPLEISSFELVGVDDNGLATLKAVVKNKSAAALTDVFLIAKDGSQLLSPTSNQQEITLEADQTVDFTITVQFDARDVITVEVKAFGTSGTGPVNSAPKSKAFDREGGLVGSTTVSQASQPGDRTLQVASNDGFQPGQYVIVSTGANIEARRIDALGSLIFDAPLAKAHAVGEPVRFFANTVDTTSPTINVTSPAAGAFVCLGAPLTAAFTCSDAVGVETCGEAVTNGQALDTGTVGAMQTTFRAWDFFGNVTENTIAWTVGICATDIDAFRCYQAKPAPGAPKFAPILGVRINGSFDDVLVDVKKPLQLCAPADTTADGLLDAETHLEAYAIKAQKGQPKPVPEVGRSVTTQLGTLVVDTGKLAQLLLPTAEDPASSPSLTINEVDRFACYQAKLAKGQPKLPKDLQLTVGDQFTSPPKRVTLKKLVRLCVPVGANGGVTKHTAHLLCFQVAATKGRCADAAPSNGGGGCKKETDCGGAKGQTIFCVAQAKFVKQPGRKVVNDLDAGTVDATKDDVLCLPALLAP